MVIGAVAKNFVIRVIRRMRSEAISVSAPTLSFGLVLKASIAIRIGSRILSQVEQIELGSKRKAVDRRDVV